MALFSPAAVAYAIHRHPELQLIPPSLKRFPMNWWIDPLQSLYMSALMMTLLTLGSIAGYRRYGRDIGYWTMVWNLSMAAGVWLGIALVTVIYRKRIASSSNCKPLN